VLETAYLYRSIQLYHSFILMFDLNLCDMLFTEINDDDDVAYIYISYLTEN